MKNLKMLILLTCILLIAGGFALAQEKSPPKSDAKTVTDKDQCGDKKGCGGCTDKKGADKKGCGGCTDKKGKVAKKSCKAQALCPVTGKKINKKVYVDYKDKRVYLADAAMTKTFCKSPDKYIKKMESQGVVFDKAPKPEKKKKTESTTKKKKKG